MFKSTADRPYCNHGLINIQGIKYNSLHTRIYKSMPNQLERNCMGIVRNPGKRNRVHLKMQVLLIKYWYGIGIGYKHSYTLLF